MKLLTVAGLCLLVMVAAIEFYMHHRVSARKAAQSMYHSVAAAHRPFAVKYADPDYGFFFLPSTGDAEGISTEMVSVSKSGFRGPGPEQTDGRKLAFLVGNSVVFGFAPHDSLTITGFLNRIQDEFFFVNAGAPSWVSRQMRDRLILELLAYQPARILFWGGYNDVSVAYRAARNGQPFDADRIEDPTPPTPVLRRLADALIPYFADRIDRALFNIVTTEVVPVKLATASKAAKAFVDNVLRARHASLSAGVEFSAVYQPILHHHIHRPAGLVAHEPQRFFDSFRSEVFNLAAETHLAVLDLSTLFDSEFAEVPVFTSGNGPDLYDQVFVDPVHLYIPGNERVAIAIAKSLGLL